MYGTLKVMQAARVVCFFYPKKKILFEMKMKMSKKEKKKRK